MNVEIVSFLERQDKCY